MSGQKSQTEAKEGGRFDDSRQEKETATRITPDTYEGG